MQCRNCQTEFAGIYCPSCGQKDINLERPLADLVAEVIRETFDVDGRAWRTVKALFRHPGLLTSEFLAGRRRVYTPPLRMYLVISVAFFVLMAWLAGQGALLDHGQDLTRDAPAQAQFITDDLPRLMFVLLPVFALLLKIAFRNRLYFDHLIHSLHLHSAAYIVLSLMLPFEKLAAYNWLLLSIQVILLAYFVAYFVMSLRRVYRLGWMRSVLWGVAILLAYMIAVSGVIETTSNFMIISD